MPLKISIYNFGATVPALEKMEILTCFNYGKTMIIGSGFIFLQNTDSTNTYANQLIRSGEAPEGTIIHTDFQTAGRGQKGNIWQSEKGRNLLFSIILYPTMVAPSEQFIISVFISLGLCDFIKTLTNCCSIKWPNDIYSGDDKLAGILIENSITSAYLNNTVAGVGLNVNQERFPEYVPRPTSLKILTGREYDLNWCLTNLACFLDKRYKQLISGGGPELRSEYISSLYRLNEWSAFTSVRGEFRGRIVSVNEHGLLIIEDENGKMAEFAFREISFVHP